MFIYKFNKRPTIENSQVISASVFVRNFYLQLKLKAKEKETEVEDLRDEDFVKDLIEMIEGCSSINLKQENNGQVEYTEPNKIKLTYTRSNLGKGFVFWFICGCCGRKVLYLYIPPNTQIAACRKCHRLAYSQQNENKRFREFNRFFK
jgi:hypothetical protein